MGTCTECGCAEGKKWIYLKVESMCEDCYNEIYLREDYDTNRYYGDYNE